MKKIMLNVLVVLMAFMSIITLNVVFAETITLSSSIVNKENGGTLTKFIGTFRGSENEKN
jgi:hypothetical protein